MKISLLVAEKLTNYLDLEDAERETFLYGFEIALTSIIGYICIIGMSCLLHTYYLVIPMLLMHSLLRSFTGGAHGSKYIYCLTLSVIVFNGLGFLLKQILVDFTYGNEFITVFNLGVLLISLYIIKKRAPVDVEEKPITSPEQRKILKKCSYAVILIWYVVVFGMTIGGYNQYYDSFLAIGIGILWQSFTLTPYGSIVFATYGKMLQKVGI